MINWITNFAIRSLICRTSAIIHTPPTSITIVERRAPTNFVNSPKRWLKFVASERKTNLEFTKYANRMDRNTEIVFATFILIGVVSLKV